MSETHILTVSQLNAQVKHTLEAQVGLVAVSGEISNLTLASSGHYYFSLKDKLAQIRCAFFNRGTRLAAPILKNGQEVIAYGKISLYEPRGDYQLIVSQIQDTGIGLLYQQFQALKNKLAALGLFDDARKKKIPLYPQHIGIISSPKGAALQDILSTLERRYPIAKTTLFSSEVQGAQAHLQLISALKQASETPDLDCIILARGGGSLEDLWAFNHEDLAYAIASCSKPIITGIGHETDFTIADFVADFRAATPTAAAEKATPHQHDILLMIRQWQIRLKNLIQSLLQHQYLRLQLLDKGWRSADKVLMQPWQRLDEAIRTLQDDVRQNLQTKHHQLSLLQAQLEAQKPILRLQTQKNRLDYAKLSLNKSLNTHLERKKSFVQQLQIKLETLSPYATLERGYAIAMMGNKVITSAIDTQRGDKIQLKLAHGHLETEVQVIHE